MRFDKTFIAIRERGTLEIFDLALHVVVDHFRPLFWLLVIGATPWALLDYWLIGWLTDSITYPAMNFYWIMLLLIISQAQVGTALMTHYLGQAMFVGRPSVWATVRGVLSTSMYFLWVHGGLRMVFPMVVLCLAPQTDDIELFVVVNLALAGSVAIALCVRAFRPYVSEILLLERTPISKKDENQVYFSRRSRSLHGAGSDLFGRFATSCLFAGLLGFSSFSAFITFDSVFLIQADSGNSYLPFFWIASLWIVAGFLAVTRFLSYIDIRIRQEGWAVELRIRAEGQRLADAID